MFSDLELFVGTEIVLRVEFHRPTDPLKIPDITDPLVDPSTVSLELIYEGVTISTWVYGIGIQVVKDAVGKYHALYVIAGAGDYKWIWRGTGAASQVDSGRFYAKDP